MQGSFLTAGYLYFTGSMWDTEVQKGAIQRAISICRQAEITVVFDLADPFAVDRYREGSGEGLGGGGIPGMHGRARDRRSLTRPLAA
jgi:sugar/nucleoside kinase (ribokinase family)